MKSAINPWAWEHAGADFQSRFDKSTAQAQEMKERRCGFCDGHSHKWNIGEKSFIYYNFSKLGLAIRNPFLRKLDTSLFCLYCLLIGLLDCEKSAFLLFTIKPRHKKSRLPTIGEMQR
jgi:hypothetical protein